MILPPFTDEGTYIIYPLRSRLILNSKLARFLSSKIGKKWPAEPCGITLTEFVFYTNSRPTEWLQWHEWRHVQQWRKSLYIFFPIVYGIGALIGWLRGQVYWKNPLEIDACKYADKHANRVLGTHPY